MCDCYDTVCEVCKNDFSPFEQVWKRYIISLRGNTIFKRIDIPDDVLNEIKIIYRRLKRRYRGLLAIILIGSFAEYNHEKNSDIDIVFIRPGRKYHSDLLDITESAKRRIQLIPFNKKQLDYHFNNSTTMAYAIQRGRIIYEKGNILRKYYTWPLGYPSNVWMKDWFNHWIDKYRYGMKDFKRSKRMDFDTRAASPNALALGTQSTSRLGGTEIYARKCAHAR